MPSASKILGDLVSSAGALSVTNTAITGTITTAQIADSAVTTEKVAASAIVTADIADGNVTAAKLANTAVTAGVYGGSSNSALITIDAQGRITSASNVAAGSGQIQTQLFTAPGTWTKPSTTSQVRVTVIGGGGGAYWNSSGGPGGTSSFGSAVSATGGSGGFSNGSYAGGGGTTISEGTAINTKGFGAPSLYTNNTQLLFFGSFSGTARLATGGAAAYSDSSPQIAGAGSGAGPAEPSGRGGLGGVAVAVVPVSAPVSVTVGTGGPAPPPSGAYAGCNGAVLVEWIG